jgi:prophage regulatory protein
MRGSGGPEQLSLSIDVACVPLRASNRALESAASERPCGEIVPALAGPDRILRTRQIVALTGHHRCTIYRWMQAGKFPQRHRFNGLPAGWRQSEVASWLAGGGNR